MKWIVIAGVAACSSAPPPREPAPALPRDAAVSVDAAVAVAVEPDAPEVLTCEPYDELNPACRTDPRVCTEGHADCKCPSPPDVENPACWATMPCPKVPDRRVRACIPHFPACDTDAQHPSCPPTSITARVIRVEISGHHTIVRIGAGAKQGVTKHLRATLLRADSDEPLRGGELTIIRVDARVTVTRTTQKLETVQANPRVRFEPP